jgi:hypothetical protein
MFLGTSIEPKLIFVAVAVIVGIINSLLEKKKKGNTAAGGTTPSVPRPQEPPARSTDEQERLRRFMESLGVPQPAQPQRQKPAPAVTRPMQPKSQPQFQQRTAQPTKPQMTRAQATPRRPAMPAPEEMRRAGRLEESATSIERISGEFSAMNVRVAMEPVQAIDSAAHLASGSAGTTSVTERDISPLVATVRKLLQKPRDLRAAFVAAEILGPPRGLQS